MNSGSALINLFKTVGCSIIFYLMGSSTYSEMILGSVVILSVRTLGGAVTLSSTILGSLVMTYSLPTI
jgi:hypothetical protein